MAVLANRSDWSDNSTFTKALVVLLAVHVVLLFMRTMAPEALDIKCEDPGFDVVPVNAKSSTAPSKTTAAAQANLNDGGGYDQ